MATLRIKKGDLVKVISGSHKGKTAKVLKASAATQTVTLEKIGIVKRHVKPSQVIPRGGTKEIHLGLPISNVALVVDEAKGTTSRIGYTVAKDGSKVRVAKRTNKEIK
jgi:large subunit ribosomal protein L24